MLYHMLPCPALQQPALPQRQAFRGLLPCAGCCGQWLPWCRPQLLAAACDAQDGLLHHLLHQHSAQARSTHLTARRCQGSSPVGGTLQAKHCDWAQPGIGRGENHQLLTASAHAQTLQLP